MALFRTQSYFNFPSMFFFFLCLLQNKASSTTENDRLALLAIKARIIDDPLQATSSWNNQSLHFCQWQGISCDTSHQRVASLNLQSLNLVGSLSASIGNLSFLRVIQLSGNSFQGEIPSEIGRLRRLQVLNLTGNSFVGQIPANLSLCSNLRVLNLENNHLTGILPMELGYLSMLWQLNANSNNITGTIPPSLGNLSSLEDLQVRRNLLQGSIPESLGQLTGLRFLLLGYNGLSGVIPPSIFNLSSLRNLTLTENHFEGPLPQNLGLTLPNVQKLDIRANQFVGLIPVSLSNLSNIDVLVLGMNKFSGGLQSVKFGNLQKLSWLALFDNNLGSGNANDLNFLSSLTNCSELRVLELDENNFGGILPDTIGNLTAKLQFLTASQNQVSGSIPEGFGGLTGLASLDMQANRLTGSIPYSFGQLYNLQQVGFGENSLSGEIPSSIGNLTQLNQLWLEGNNLQGSIPSSLGKCQSLLLLHLYGNNLSGSIPPEVIGLSSLSISLKLSWNHLNGPLPSQVGSLTTLVELDVSHNEISGTIPSSLARCTTLGRLYMDHNSFQGPIPESLASLKGLEALDISSNNLSGAIPNLDSILLLRHLNLSFNNLEGKVPVGGVFGNQSAFSISGNSKLCGGIPSLHLPTCSTVEPKRRQSGHRLKLLLPLLCSIFGIAVLSFFLVRCWLIKLKKKPSAVKDTSAEPFAKISYGQLLKATDGFSSLNLIGNGGFGSVYRGNLYAKGATIVAVKVLNLENRGASKSFLAECQALRNTRHRNLVRILTACSSVDYQGNDFKALVYEFMENGSLERWLYPLKPKEEDVSSEQPSSLNLLQRLNVAIEVAFALEYLHNHGQVPIVHCDLKPSNILLDGEFTAHVGDFGLAKFLKQHNQGTSFQISSSIKGTIGYVAPEYAMGSDASTCGDVYSFGIIMLEMFMGKKPTDGMFHDGLNLHKLAAMALSKQLVTEFLAQTLLLDVQVDETTVNNSWAQARMDVIHSGLASIFRIGVMCSKEEPRERMTITEAAAELQRVRDMLREDDFLY